MFFLFLNLNMILRNSAQKEFACIWQSKWVGVIAIEIKKKPHKIIHFLSDVFVARRLRGILTPCLFLGPIYLEAGDPM